MDVKFGRIVEIAEDFDSADLWNPISLVGDSDGRTRRFEQAVRSLLENKGGGEGPYFKKLCTLLDGEAEAVRRIAEKGGDGTARAYKEHAQGFPTDKQFTDAVGTVNYATTAWMNMDHFVSGSHPTPVFRLDLGHAILAILRIPKILKCPRSPPTDIKEMCRLICSRV